MVATDVVVACSNPIFLSGSPDRDPASGLVHLFYSDFSDVSQPHLLAGAEITWDDQLRLTRAGRAQVDGGSV
jgi:hypothetical protein